MDNNAAFIYGTRREREIGMKITKNVMHYNNLEFLRGLELRTVYIAESIEEGISSRIEGFVQPYLRVYGGTVVRNFKLPRVFEALFYD